MTRLLRRPKWLALLVFGLAVFLVLSGLLARWLSLEGVERDDVLTVLRAQARGDQAAMLANLHQCTSSCRANVRYDARTLRRSGPVLILAYTSQTAYALTSAEGWTRVAWKTGTRLPVVQCFKVTRKGNALSGLTVRLLRVTRPIPSTSDC